MKKKRDFHLTVKLKKSVKLKANKHRSAMDFGLDKHWNLSMVQFIPQTLFNVHLGQAAWHLNL